MERDEIPKTLCRSGCGFYGSSATDGLCSVCFKEALKKKCVPNSASAGSASGGGSTATATASVSVPDQQPVVPIGGDQSNTTATVTASAIIDVSQSSSPSPPGPSTSKAQTSEEEEEDKKPGKTKNRCDTCRKKVGLTGFDCRCGGRFCAIHRYSDLHECSFNYRELGRQEIRNNNPQTVAQKINKI